MSVRGFNTGTGVERYDYNALDNVPLTTNTRVKGDAEVEYREGDVNLTKANIGLGNVDNTSDANKPVSTAQQNALNGKVDKVTGKGLSTNDYTNEDKQKVDDAALQSDLDDLSLKLSDETTGLDTKAPVILNTVSGDIASFSDGADSMPIKSLVATIEPVQDLHGYDSPWPAGGGTNVCDEVFEQGTINSSGNNAGDNTRIRTVNYIPIQPNTQYFAVTPGVLGVRYYDANKTFLGSSYSTTVYNNTTFTTPEGAYYMRFSVVDVSEYANNIAINYPPTVTTYSPYSNECPISGWTGLNGARTGKNIFGGNAMKEAILTNIRDSTADGSVVTYPASKARGAILFEGFQPNTQYTLLLNLRRTDTTVIVSRDINLAVKYTDGTETTLRVTHDGTGNRVNYKFLTNASKSVANFKGVYNSSSTEIDTAMSGIFVGNVDWDDFEPYNDDSETISVNWQSTAGEVYGGTLDVISGKMATGYGIYTMTGNESITRTSSGYFVSTTPLPNVAKAKTGGYAGWCSHYKVVELGSSTFYATDNALTYSNTSISTIDGRYAITDSRFDNADDFKSFLSAQVTAGTPVQIVYELAEPITYQLTPQEVTTLLGTNHVWTDVGPVEVTYPADTKLFIEKLTQPTEDDMTADHAIASGTFFQLGNTLYLATAAIAAGATITPGTNATKLSLADALNSLNS